MELIMKDNKLCNFLAVLLVCAWFLIAGLIIFAFNGCANEKCYPKKYGNSICENQMIRGV